MWRKLFKFHAPESDSQNMKAIQSLQEDTMSFITAIEILSSRFKAWTEAERNCKDEAERKLWKLEIDKLVAEAAAIIEVDEDRARDLLAS